MKKFCIAGPVDSKKHYILLRRLNREQLNTLIEDEEYFVLHAPRQSGKTTGVEEYVSYLREEGKYSALYINVEPAQAARDSIEKALRLIVELIKNKIAQNLGDHETIVQKLEEMLKEQPTSLNLLYNALQAWASHSKKPIVLFIDEIDSLIGDSLLSVLRQIRAGFNERPDRFPQSIGLIGLRDVRDYRIWSKEQGAYISSSSPFNIKAESLTLKNFSLEQIKNLYLQHTQETGQLFTEEAIGYAYFLTQGQPWLVNALAHQACLEQDKPIGKEEIERAKDKLIARRDTHIDSLVDKLHESRVRTVIDAIINGSVIKPTFTDDDIQYTIDLGLVSNVTSNLTIANPIYQEIIPAVLAWKFQVSIVEEAAWYLKSNGRLDMTKLLKSFTQFFRENSQAWLEDFHYKESAPHILLLAFMQRVINGCGQIHREYALGTKRVDLLISWKDEKFVLELKIKYSEDSLAKGLEQTAMYMETVGATEGHLILFDRDPSKSWDEKISQETVTFATKTIRVWTM